MSAPRRLRSACASAQSGHGLFCVPRGALGCNVVALQAGLGLYRAQ